MKIRHIAIIVSLLVAFASARFASATPPTVDYSNNTMNIGSKTGRYAPQRPTVSPYLAIAQNVGNLSFVNYFTITRPLFAQQQTNRGQGRELERLERQVRSESQPIDPVTGQPTIRSTGHRTGFMTQSPYFGGVKSGQNLNARR
jgi:hypothetical protein